MVPITTVEGMAARKTIRDGRVRRLLVVRGVSRLFCPWFLVRGLVGRRHAASRCNGPMQRRHLLVLADSLGNLLAPRRGCGVADTVNDDPIHDGGDPGDARRNDDERDDHPAAPSPTPPLARSMSVRQSCSPLKPRRAVAASAQPRPALLTRSHLLRAHKTVVCSPGFHTSTIRNVPDSEKHAVEIEYGMEAAPLRPHARDRPHRLLELGGSNDIANLYPETGRRDPDYHVKDKLENKLHALVCAGPMAYGPRRPGSRQTGRRCTRRRSRSRHRRRPARSASLVHRASSRARVFSRT